MRPCALRTSDRWMKLSKGWSSRSSFCNSCGQICQAAVGNSESRRTATYAALEELKGSVVGCEAKTSAVEGDDCLALVSHSKSILPENAHVAESECTCS